MDAPTHSTRVTAWLKACRGDETQEAVARDITERTGWRITRDRYSRYESGSLPIGKQTYEHFVEYWAGRGKEAPDLSAPAEEPAEPSLAAAISALVDELRASRLEREATEVRLRAVEAELAALRALREGAGSPGRSAPHGTAG